MSGTDDSTPATAPADARISDDEVDALLEKRAMAGTAAKARGAGVAAYDLVAPDKISRGRLPALDRVNERWLGEFQRELADLVRRPLEMSMREVQLCSFGEWQAALPALGSLNLFAVKPWRRSALVAVDGRLLFVLVDAYYGGEGRVAQALGRRDLTPAERRLNATVVTLLARHFQAALEPVAAIELEHQKTETNPQYVQIATSSEIVAVTCLDVSLLGAEGTLSLVLPLSMLDPVRDKLSEGLRSASKEVAQRWAQTLRSQLERTELELRTVFMQTEVTVRELLQLEPGDILPIEMPKTATLFAGMQPLLAGKFGLSRGYNAISIVETAVEAPTKAKEERRP